MSRLFVSDMDGTLLGADSLVSPESSRIISGLSRRGVFFTVATARTPATVEPLLAGTITLLPAIVMTGAAFWDRERRSFISPRCMDPELELETVHLFLEFEINPFIYTLSGDGKLEVFHNGEMTSREKNFYLDRKDLPLKRFVFNRGLAYTDPLPSVILLLGIGSSERVLSLAARLRLNTQLSVSTYCDPLNPSVAYIEVFAAGISKSEAVLKLAEMTRADGITVYGDNLNDLPMMDIADDAVAVENALPEVKEKADRIIGPNTASSVALDVMSRSGLTI